MELTRLIDERSRAGTAVFNFDNTQLLSHAIILYASSQLALYESCIAVVPRQGIDPHMRVLTCMRFIDCQTAPTTPLPLRTLFKRFRRSLRRA